MREFFEITLSFPPIIFTFGMILVIMYWLVVMLGLFDIDVFDADVEADGDGFLGSLGFGAVPATIILSLWILTGWLVTMLGTIWLRSTSDSGIWITVGGIALLMAGLGLGILIAKVLSRPLSHVFQEPPQMRHEDLIGKTCLIRSGSVTTEFGQGEVLEDDGSSHIVNIRRSEHEPSPVGDEDYKGGSRVVIFDYVEDGNYYLVVSGGIPDVRKTAEEN